MDGGESMLYVLVTTGRDKTEQCLHDETNKYYGLFPPTETVTEKDSHMDYHTEQVFPLVRRQIPIPLLKYSKIGMEICPWDRDLSLKWVQ